MKTLPLSLVVLAAVPGLARADGPPAGCDENHDGRTDCHCSTGDPVAVGASLGVAGIVAWGIGRKRKPR